MNPFGERRIDLLKCQGGILLLNGLGGVALLK